MWKRHKLNKAYVVKFNCEGCMASDHRFQWIGQVYGFEPATEGYTFALVKILKSVNRSGDIRDGGYPPERITVEDTQLQQIGPKLFFYYK